MNNLGNLTIYELGAEDFSVTMKENEKHGLDIEVIREEDGETYGEIGLHKCAAESLALFCRSYLSAYDSVTKND